MFIRYRTLGIILKKENRGEANQLFTIYTKDFGKLEILGKAIRKISSKLRSDIDIFYLSNIEFIQGKNYKTLTDALVIEKYENIKKNLGKLKIIYKIAEIFDRLVHGQEKDEKIWNLLFEVLKNLNEQNLRNKNQQLFFYYFLWKFLSILGYEPQLYNCSICQKKVKPETIYFVPKEGGIICRSCSKKFKKSKIITPEVIKIIRFLLSKEWQTVSKLKIDDYNFKLLKTISEYFFSFIEKSIIGNI